MSAVDGPVALADQPGEGLVLPSAPTDDEKMSYAWRSLPYLASAITVSALCIIIAQAWLEARYLIALPFAFYTLSYLIYQALSIPVNFGGRFSRSAAMTRTSRR